MTRMRPYGPRTREHAANLCSSRAAAEADPDFHVGHPMSATRVQHVWSPSYWTQREQMLAMAAFRVAIATNGAGVGKAPSNWAEAEAMIRTGWEPSR